MLRLLLALLLTAAPLYAAPPKDVSIAAPDGAALKATYFASATPGPAVLLLHMCNTDRRSWEPVGRQLSEAGIHALTLDYRGFGESPGARFDTLAPQDARKLVTDTWPGDIDAALAFLMSQPGVDRTRIGVGGGSCGVTQAVQVAQRHGEVRSLVLLAGPIDQDGRRFLVHRPWLPVFASAAADDQFDNDAPQAMRWVTELGGNPRNTFVGFADGKHGTEIFGPHPELPRQIVAWLVDTLVKNPADPKATVTPTRSAAREFWALVDEPGGMAKAVESFHQTRQRAPQMYLFPEGMMNLTGYERLQAGKNAEAIALFTLNTEAFPSSANAQDSLGDAYRADSQNALALAAAEKSLALLPADRVNDRFKAAIRQSAEQKIRELKPAPQGARAETADQFTIPATDDGLPGAGPIRRYDWFQQVWRERRSAWATQREKDQGAVVFLGDSITQGWEDGLGMAFPELKIANRGINGDTTRGVLLRLKDDVLVLNPAVVVLLIGTNDLEEGASPETIVGNLKLLVAALEQHNQGIRIILCEVFPSSATKKRPADQIKAINTGSLAAVKGDPHVIALDTWQLFADANGDAIAAEFPDLLHPNKAGYAKWAAGLRPLFATLGLVDTTADAFTPEEGFESLFDGRDLTGWGYRPTSPADRENAKKWQASDPNAAAWPFVDAPAVFDGATATPDGRFVVVGGRLVVTTPPEGRKIQQLWTTREFGDDFVLKLEFRATPNADSGVYLRGPQLQCRDYGLAGPYKDLTHYKPQDWNELVVTVHDGVALATCNGEVLESNFKLPATGPIGLEGDRGQMEYRRIRIKRLPHKSAEMTNPELLRLRDFATRYTAAWCSQNAASVAAFFAPDGSLKINDGAPAVGRTTITAAAQDFMTTFPDMKVLMDNVSIEEGKAVFHWTLVGTKTGPGGTDHHVRISGFEQWRIGPEGLIAESQGHFDAADYRRQLDGRQQ